MPAPVFDELAIDVLTQALRPLGEVTPRVRIDLEPVVLSMFFTPGPRSEPPQPDPVVQEIARTHPLDPLGGLGPRQLAPALLGGALSQLGTLEVNKRIEPEPGEHLILSLWFKPGPPPAPLPGYLALVAAMSPRPTAFEIPAETVDDEVFYHCHWTHLEWYRLLRQRGELEETGSLPPLWIICRDATPRILESDYFGLRRKPGWLPGFYESSPGMRHTLVVLKELPLERQTALLHLLGSAAQRGRALAWIHDLPEADADRAALLALSAPLAS